MCTLNGKQEKKSKNKHIVAFVLSNEDDIVKLKYALNTFIIIILTKHGAHTIETKKLKKQKQHRHTING